MENTINIGVSYTTNPAPSSSASSWAPESTAPADPDLAVLVAAWPIVPAAIRAGIVAMVRASAMPTAAPSTDGGTR